MKKNLLTVEISPDQLDLCRKLGSKNKTESYAAQEALAAFLPKPILEPLNQAAIIGSLFQTTTYNTGEAPLVYLDPLYDVRKAGLFTVWSQYNPGGIASSLAQGQDALYVQTRPLNAALSLNKKALLAGGGLDYLGKMITRVLQELLVKQETDAAYVLMASLAGARIDFDRSNNDASNLVLARSAVTRVFGPNEFNKIMTAYDRVVSSWSGGTPEEAKNGIDTITGSVEFFGQMRAMAYNPVNTRSGALATSGATAIAAPEGMREDIFRSGGIANFMGVDLRKCWDFGVGRAYNTLLGNALGSQVITGYADSGTAAFTPASEEVVVGVNSNMTDLIRMREVDGGNQIQVTPDDSADFSLRSKKVGFTFEVTEGFVSVDARARFGLIW